MHAYNSINNKRAARHENRIGVNTMKKVTINGVSFELTKTAINHLDDYKADDIFGAYEKPSSTKIECWFRWSSWIERSGQAWIATANTFNFTIAGLMNDTTTGKLYAIYITKDHRRAYEVDDMAA